MQATTHGARIELARLRQHLLGVDMGPRADFVLALRDTRKTGPGKLLRADFAARQKGGGV